MNNIKISVVIPVYNPGKYLKECLDSVLNQTLKELEIICVNDGSTDGSLEVLREYEKLDNRIKILDKKNEGAGMAKNDGLEMATGEYVHFLDSDDYLFLSAYEKLYNSAIEHDADMIKAKGQAFDNETKQFNKSIFDLPSIESDDFNVPTSFYKEPQKIICLPIAPWNGIYKRSVLMDNTIRFSDLIAFDDNIFQYHMIVHCKTIILLDEYIVYYRTNLNSSLTGSQYIKNFYCIFVTYRMTQKLFCNLEDEYQEYIYKYQRVCIKSFFNSYKDDEVYGYLIKLQTKAFFKSIDFELDLKTGNIAKISQ